MTLPIILSHLQTTPLLAHRGTPDRSLEISPDLGLSTLEATLTADGAIFPSGQQLSWGAVQEISDTPNNCFAIKDGQWQKVTAFSELTNRTFTLTPTNQAPAMLISGVPMHRRKGTTPNQSTAQMVQMAGPIVGQVLDTATGLGYTSIEAAKYADQVTTIELDPAAVEMARANPWSRALFDSPKINRLSGDSNELIETFTDATFSRIIHDPPMLSLAGDLYGLAFYQQLHRVLVRGGKLFHYLGNLESRAGERVVKGVIKRLQETGFTRVERRGEAFGVVAFK